MLFHCTGNKSPFKRERYTRTILNFWIYLDLEPTTTTTTQTQSILRPSGKYQTIIWLLIGWYFVQEVLKLSFCKLFWIWVLKFIASHVSKTHTAGGSLKLKVIMVVHFLRGCKIEITPLPNIASRQADGWVNSQFSQMMKNKKFRNKLFILSS